MARDCSGVSTLSARLLAMTMPKVFRVDFVFGDLAVLELAHQRGRAQAHLVHAVAAIHHHGVLGAQALHRAHLDAHQIGVEHAHQDIGRAGRIGQRAQQVEDGAHAQLAAHRRHVLHGRVVVGREHEANAGLGNALRDLRRARLMLRPSASSTSALPLLLLTLRPRAC
jgi:hypothetical protein